MKIRPLLVAASAVLSVSLSFAAEIFPTPLHITRVIEDPIARTTTVINEYMVGDRVIAVRGARTTIADYAGAQLTEIDREARTYSITSFEAIAVAREASLVRATAASSIDGTEATLTPRSVSGRMADVRQFVPSRQQSFTRVEVAVDRSIELSREAFEVVIGSRYPAARNPRHDVLLRAAMTSSTAKSQAPRYHLPLEDVIEYLVDGETVRERSTVTAVDSQLPNPELTSIPPGATRIESKLTALPRALDEADRLPTSNQR